MEIFNIRKNTLLIIVHFNEQKIINKLNQRNFPLIIKKLNKTSYIESIKFKSNTKYSTRNLTKKLKTINLSTTRTKPET